jgi:hypothetical protein
MMSYDAHDANADSLRRLMMLAADPDRAARVRARCRTQLVRSRRRAVRTSEISAFASRVFAPFVVGAFCAFYVAMLVATTLRLETMFD